MQERPGVTARLAGEGRVSARRRPDPNCIQVAAVRPLTITSAEMDRNSLGLPPTISACLFDLDGVLTQTAKVHARAWKAMFDAYLKQRAEQTGEAFRPFDEV